MKTEVTKEKAIEDLRTLFEINDGSMENGYESTGSFGISKMYLGRGDVIQKLQDYFSDKMFVVGYGISVHPLTLVYTTFKIIEI